MTKVTPATFLVVGDVHGHWREEDTRYVESTNPALTMFVGDLGDEDVALIDRVAALRTEKVVILGNHDAWQSFTEKRVTPALTAILSRLGPDHLAYGVREVPAAGVSVIGARPFSWGGRSLRSVEVYQALYGVQLPADSTKRIVTAARKAKHRDLIILAHNGPSGLSSRPSDIWGKDFGEPGGDWGDRDLADALTQIRELGMRVRCVVAGHMHDRLMTPRGVPRSRFVDRDGTLYLNPAVVPRVRRRGDGPEVGHFLRLHVHAGELLKFEEIWV